MTVRKPSSPDPASVRYSGPWAHRDVSANGIRLHIAEAGSGPLVVLLHGFPEFWWSWRYQLPALAEAGFRAVAVDLRGYGDTDKPPRGYDGWTLAGDVAGLIRALGEPRAHVIGQGWGGMLAWTLGALHPRLVASIGALSAPHPLALRRAVRSGLLRGGLLGGDRNQARALRHVFAAQIPLRAERTLQRTDAVREHLHAWSGPARIAEPDFAADCARNSAAMRISGVAHSALEYYRWAMRSQLRPDGRRFAADVDRRSRVPVLQCHGALDPLLLETTARESASWRGPHSLYHVFDGAGHFLNQEDPVRLNTLIARFCAEVDARGR
ncbi:MAG: alpha/beta fold hydrolase [Sciscionella sp.]